MTASATLRRHRIDPRVRKRRLEVARQQGRRRLRRLATITMVLAVLGGVVAVALSPVFEVRHVRVEGVPEPLLSEVQAKSDRLIGRPLLLADTDGLAAELARDPRLAGVRVLREPPGTVRVSAARRLAVAVAATRSGFALVAPDGVVVDRAIVPMPGLPGLVGEKLADAKAPRLDQFVPALGALRALPPAVATRLRQVRVESGGDVVLVLDGGIPVAFGAPDRDAARKGQVLEALMAEAEARGTDVLAYTVVTPDAPAVLPSRNP